MTGSTNQHMITGAPRMQPDLESLANIAEEAGRAIMQVRAEGFEAIEKDDHSAPSLSGYAPDAVIIAIIREQDAFDAARSVCPALVPRKVIVDWERDWEPRAGK